MTRIAIVEDEPAVAQQIEQYTKKYLTEHNIQGETACFADGMALAEGYRPLWDIIFLDIEMPQLDGMSAAQYIRQKDPTVILIFITNMARYAIKGYEVGALDFVLKPVNYAQFAMKLRRALEQAAQRVRHSIIVSVGGEQRRIVTEQLLYIEVRGHWLSMHLSDEVIEISGSLQQMEEKLAGQPFVRSSNSYLVNLRYVKNMRRDAVTLGAEELPLSRGRRAEFLQKLSDYMSGGSTA